MTIRKATEQDIGQMMAIYGRARAFMAEHGNPNQWGPTGWPPEAVVRGDIAEGTGYVCVEGGEILAVFCYLYVDNPEPLYDGIREGSWLKAGPYGVVHRIAAARSGTGAGAFCLEWAFRRSGHLRIDTHPDNTVMQALLEKLGFARRGIVSVAEDNDPRIAFERV